MRDHYKVKEEWVAGFDPVPIIDIPEYGNLSAVKLCEDHKIQSQKDVGKLKEIKEVVYTKGFYQGKMLVGVGEGKLVHEAKPLVKAAMLEDGTAATYWEPESLVKSRSGDECVVALCDQWFLKYGEEEWQKAVMSHVKSDKFNAYTQNC